MLPRQLLLAVLFYFLSAVSFSHQKRQCTDSETKYILTECDQTHGRWRIHLPDTDACELAQPEQPLRVSKCDTSCPGGKYYDINGDMACHSCKPGYYSFGRAEEFTSWGSLPRAFSVDQAITTKESNVYDTLNKTEAKARCDMEATIFSKNSLGIQANSCVVILSYAATLSHNGIFEMYYRNSGGRSNYASIQIENNACEKSRDQAKAQSLKGTGDNEWRFFTADLSIGTSVVSIWLERGPFATDTPEPLLIKNITVTGIAYTSECKPCPKGTFAANNQSPRCHLCSANTYADEEGSTSCKPCGDDEFSEEGAEICQAKKPCSTYDYYAESGSCDALGYMMLTYKWLEPHRCSETKSGAVKLPDPIKKPCPNCNIGQFYNTTTDSRGRPIKICSFCPKGTYSDGISPCKPCPATGYPITGIFWRLWRQPFPEDTITNECEGEEDECTSPLGWHGTDEYLQSVNQATPLPFSILTVKITNARRPVKLSILFEMECDDNCLFLIATTPPAGTDLDEADFEIIYRGEGSKQKKLGVFELSTSPPFDLLFMFRKLSRRALRKIELSSLLQKGHLTLSGAFDRNNVKIYEVNITNVEPGGMGECIDCANLDPQPRVCQTCQAGSYRVNKSVCAACPVDSVTPAVNVATQAGGVGFAGDHSDTCQPCPPHMRAAKSGLTCYSDCKFAISTENAMLNYNMSSLGTGSVFSLPMFLPSGTKYETGFNITLCGDGKPQACKRGRTSSLEMSTSTKQTRRFETYGRSRVCTASILQPDKEIWSSKIVGDRLVAIDSGDVADAVKSSGVTLPKQFPAIFNSSNLPKSGYSQIPDVIFTFTSDEESESCPNGSVVVVVARCDPATHSAMALPASCPTGSCNNCHYLILWTALAACPTCDNKDSDYEIVNGECSLGRQEVYRYPKKHCILMGKEREVIKTQACNPLPLAAQIILLIVGVVVVILAVVLLYMCKRTRKLQYRYMKLVESTGLNENELPVVESCAVDVDDEVEYDAATQAESMSNQLDMDSTSTRKMERMKLSSGKVKKFRTVEAGERRGGGGGSSNNAFFEPGESPQMESLMNSRPSVL